jgi:DNA-binding Lrp family transcriptional regulator
LILRESDAEEHSAGTDYPRSVQKNRRSLQPGPAPRARPILDEVDRSIIAALAADARVTNSALAEAVGVAASTCLSRVRSLRERGVLRGFHADVDLGMLGLPIQALVAVRLSGHRRDYIDQFRAHVIDLTGVIGTFHVSGSNDYLLHVAAESTDALRDFVVDRIATHPTVVHAETSLIFDYIRGSGPMS